MRLFCTHNYEIIKEYEIKSQLQMMIENGLLTMDNCPLEMFKSKYIIVYKCIKCGKIKETVVNNE